MATVFDILAEKGATVHATSRTATVYDAIEKMVRHNVGALVVLDAGAMCGIITERDYLRRIALEGRTSKTVLVEEIMSQSPECVSTETTIEECMEIMTEKRVRHLPVLVSGRLSGIVSIGDVVKRVILDQAAHIQDLVEYIQGPGVNVVNAG